MSYMYGVVAGPRKASRMGDRRKTAQVRDWGLVLGCDCKRKRCSGDSFLRN